MTNSNTAANASRKKKKLVLELHAKAHFRSADGARRWSSELAWARVVYRPERDDIVIAKTYGQKPKGDATAEWARPIFPRASMERMRSYARRVYNGEVVRGSGDGKGHLKGHQHELCERCAEGRCR